MNSATAKQDAVRVALQYAAALRAQRAADTRTELALIAARTITRETRSDWPLTTPCPW